MSKLYPTFVTILSDMRQPFARALDGSYTGLALRHTWSRLRAGRRVPLSAPTTTPNADPPEFTCEVLPERDAVRVRPIGSLDIATAPVLEQQLQELREAGSRRLIVDLGGLSFMDSTGLKLALKWDAAARQDGFQICFTPGPPVVQRVFEITGTSGRLPFIHS